MTEREKELVEALDRLCACAEPTAHDTDDDSLLEAVKHARAVLAKEEMPDDIWKDPQVMEALKERSADDIMCLRCRKCDRLGYYTIGGLFDLRHDDESARGRLFGFVSNYEPKGWTGRDGKERPPNQIDLEFRKQLDAFQAWFEKNHPGEKI